MGFQLGKWVYPKLAGWFLFRKNPMKTGHLGVKNNKCIVTKTKNGLQNYVKLVPQKVGLLLGLPHDPD